MPQLYEVIVLYDVVAYAESAEDARAAVLAQILAGLMGDADFNPSEQTARDIGKRPVRDAWKNESPIVGNAVSDADFERVKGKTCDQVWQELNVKTPDDKKSKPAK